MSYQDRNLAGLVRTAAMLLLLASALIASASAGRAAGFGAAKGYATGAAPLGAAAGDFNRDGRVDLAAANSGANSVSVLLGNGDGTFKPAAGYLVNNITLVIQGDFNGDGRADLLAGSGADGNLYLLAGVGDGTFKSAATAAYAYGIPSAVFAADLNGDGLLDVASASGLTNKLSVIFGNGDGTFKNEGAQFFDLGASPSGLAVADFNRDGRPDLVASNADSGSTDPDTDAPADTIASYTFDFGDGSPKVTQPTAIITHTYQDGNYRAEVRVTDSRGKQSENVAGVNLEVSPTGAKPIRPTNLTGTPSANGTQVRLLWNDNANNEKGFRVESCQNEGCTSFQQVGTTNANVTSFVSKGLTSNTTYRYRVRAHNTAGDSAASNIVKVTTN